MSDNSRTYEIKCNLYYTYVLVWEFTVVMKSRGWVQPGRYQVLGEDKFWHGSIYTPKEKQYNCSFKHNIKINLKIIEYEGEHWHRIGTSQSNVR